MNYAGSVWTQEQEYSRSRNHECSKVASFTLMFNVTYIIENYSCVTSRSMAMSHTLYLGVELESGHTRLGSYNFLINRLYIPMCLIDCLQGEVHRFCVRQSVGHQLRFMFLTSLAFNLDALDQLCDTKNVH